MATLAMIGTPLLSHPLHALLIGVTLVHLCRPAVHVLFRRLGPSSPRPLGATRARGLPMAA